MVSAILAERHCRRRASRSGAAAGRAHSDDGCDHLLYARARPHTIGWFFAVWCGLADDLDASLLMWDMQRRVRPEQFPARRVVVGFEFRDVVRARRRRWLVSEGSTVDLCVTDPGYEVDLFIVVDLRTITAVWVGDMALRSAIASGKLEVHGPPQLRAKLGSWLALSPFATVKDQRALTSAEVVSPPVASTPARR